MNAVRKPRTSRTSRTGNIIKEVRMRIRYRWSPDLNLNSIGPLVRDPDNLSPVSLRRNRLFLDMLIGTGGQASLQRARKIIVAHPQLRAEYADKIQARAKRLSSCR